MTENIIQRHIVDYLRKQGHWCVKIEAGGSQLIGLPDLLLCYKGRFIAIEVKQPGCKPRPSQVIIGEQIKSAGGEYIVATSVDDIKRQLLDI